MVDTDILLHPYVSEKTMNALLGTPLQNQTDGNRIEFMLFPPGVTNTIAPGTDGSAVPPARATAASPAAVPSCLASFHTETA